MRRVLVVLVTAAATMAALAGCGGGNDNPLGGGGGGGGGNGGSGGTITVGSANFPENSLLAEIYAQALEAKGVKVSRHFNIGDREAYIPALKDGSIDLLPEYTGNLLSYLKSGKVPGRNLTADQVYAQLQQAMPDGLTVLDMSAAEDKDAVVVTQETQSRYDLSAIGDLKPVAPKLVLGGPPEWETRFTGVPGLAQVYGLHFKQFKKLDVGGPITVKALKDGKVDAANLFTTDPSIATNHFVVLDDPKHLFLAQNVTPIINAEKASDTVTQALNAVSAKLTTDNLKAMMEQIVIDHQDEKTVAKQFLTDNGITQ